ncbi:Ig-like domain-containing protein [Conexibacter sp. JD483]|uniref:Ig-like domain-containing protein n=1 Tax=unclassified Conexibacter TaxID=2627773 RepID=UPI00271AE2CD|nr:MULTISPECIES: Ig-like domain-containing protein [unclassified Conexibacter]MDO8186374.1 Ig-like domain-containing protein [Conexibacter sp. CPCC 205706]MDO8199773.1 Ig-like domain-containing protein [Conexibacter sp. CPCC 205762]MDR9371134.1 Ig-like domain-containing protein [Conexibacter sp. JD483]
MTVSGNPSGADRSTAQGLRGAAAAMFICAIALIAFASPARAISPASADRAALRALGSERGDAPVIVFRQGRPLAAGTVVRQAGAERASASSAFAPNTAVRRDRLRRAGADVTRAPQVIRVGGEAAWLYYEDRGPFRLYQHPGRVALVGVDSGTVRVSASFDWPPLVAGRPPLYLRNAVAYRDRRFRVFTRLPRVAGTARKDSARKTARGTTVAAKAGADRAALALARAHACGITVADMLGNAYDYASVDRTRAAVGSLLSDLEKRDRGFVAARYSTRDGLTPSAFVTRLIRGHGCKSVLLWIAGGGVEGGQPTVSLGASGHADGRLEQQDLRADELRALLRANPGTDFQLLVDAPYAGGLIDALKSEPNLRVLLTASERDETAYACIPGSRSLCPAGSGATQLAFTSRVLTGIDGLLADSGAVDKASAAVAGGTPFLGSLLTEGFARGNAAAKLKPLGVHPQQFVNFPKGGGGPAPQPQSIGVPPFAQDQSVSTDEDRAIRIDLASDPIQALTGFFSIVRNPAHGRLSDFSFPTNRFLTYTPDPDFNGSDTFQFRVTVALLISTTATVTVTVRAVNDAPVVTTSAGATAFTEGDPATAIDAALTVRDVDSPNLTGATIAIGGGFAGGEDQLVFSDTATIRGSFERARGVLTLSGRAPLADYERALRSVAYANAGRDPRAGPRSVAFSVTDGALTSAAATKTVTVRAIADPPVVTLSGGTVRYTENDPATTVDGGLTVSDPDSTDGSGATVQIVSGLAAGQDVLELTAPPAGISASYDAPSGTLRLSGRASLAAYQTALRGVRYRNTSDAPSTVQRSIRFLVTDAGGTSSAPVAARLDVIAVNDVPTAGDDAYSTNEGVTVTDAAPGVLANDSDLDGDTLTVTEVDGAGANVSRATRTARGGTVTIDADGALRYDPSGVASGLRRGQSIVDSIAYTVEDGNGGRATATVRFTVTAVNDAPDAVDDAYRTDEQTPLSIAAPGVLGNDSDPDGDTLAVDQADGSGANVGASFRSARGATVLIRADGSLSYDPAGAFDALRAGEEARDTIGYRVSDGNGGTDSATIAVTISGDNDAPVAADDAYRTDQDTPLTVAAPGLLANDRDAEGDTLTIDQVDGSGGNVGSAFRSARGATVRVNADGSLSYDPAGAFDALRAGEEASDTISYRVSDGNGGTDTATISVTVSGVNDRPVAAGDAYSTDEDTLLTVAAPGVLRNDTDADGDTLAVSQVDGSAGNVGRAFTSARGATVRVNADGSLSYDPNGRFETLRAGQRVDDSVTYEVSDGNGGSDTATISVTVSGVNDRPVAAADAYRTDEDTLLTVAAPGVLRNDSDADGDTLAVDQVDGSAGNVGRAFTSARGATVRVNADGSLSYDPNGRFDALRAGEEARDTISYRVSDGNSGTDTATISVTVSGVNDRPIAVGDAYSTDEDTALTVPAPGVLANDSDAEGDTLTVSQVDGSPANVGTTFRAASGALVTIGADGAVRYDPNGRFNSLRAGQRVDDTVTYEVSDGNGGTATATVRFTLTGVNDRPDAIDDTVRTDEDTVATLSAPGLLRNDTDADGDTLTVDQVNGAAGNVGRAFRTARGATVRVGADGSLSYDPTGQFDALKPGEQATDSFTYRASDGNGGTDTATVSVTIDGVNDAPSAAADSYDGVGNTTLVVSDPVPAGEAAKQLTGSVEDNDSDPDNSSAELSVRAERVSSRLGGFATLQSDGSFTYVPPTGTTATSDSFDYTISDGSATARGTVTVRLAGRVWYVDNTEAAGGTGRSSDAFDTLGEATTAAGSGDTIFVHTGDGGTTGQNAGAVLGANERLIGEADDLVIGGDLLYDGTAARRPSIGNAGGAGVTLANGSTVQGLAIAGSGGAAISGRSGTAGSTIADVTLSGNSGGIALSGTTGTFNVSDVDANVSGGAALSAANAGTLNLTSAGTIALRSSGGRAVDVSGTALSGAIDSATASGSGGGVALQTTTGSIAFGDVAVNVSGGTGFLADTVAGLSVPAAGTVNVADSGGTAVAIRNNTAPSVTFDTVSGTGAGTTGIDVTGNRGGGTTTFSGTTTTSTGSGAGVNLDNNTGHAIAFGGPLSVTTTSGAGFSATRGGTVTATGAGSRIGSTTGTALKIDSTTIGAADATFQSISANGAANGVVLNQTGSSGNLAVTGTGAAGSGGTITNIRGADGSTAGIGLYLNQTSGPAFRSLALSNNDGWAVRGTSVSGLSLDSSTINGTNGTNDAFDEGSVYLTDPTGATGITNSAISGAVEDNVHVNATTGTLDLTFSGNDVGANSTATGSNAMLLETRNSVTSRATVSGNQFRSSREDLFQATTTDQASSTVNVTGNTMTNAQTQVSGAGGILLQTAGSGAGTALRYLVQNNRVSGTLGPAVFVQKGTGIATAQGRIDNNQVGVAGVTGSGSRQGSGIDVEARGQGTHTYAITNNTVRQVQQDGIALISGEDGIADSGVVTVNATVSGNTVAEPAIARTLTGFRSEMADPAATVTECLDLQGNTLTGSGPFGGDVRILHDFPQNTIRLPGYAGGAQDGVAVENYIAARNTLSTVNAFPPGSGPGFVNGGAGCTQPS